MKGYDSETYGDGAQKTGLVLSLVDHVTREPIEWPTFPPLAADDIEMDGWPVDADGRGLTVVEMEHLTLTEKAA